MIACGFDVQDDRLECTLAGWTRTSECLVLGHIVLRGPAEDDSTWAELDELLRARWQHPNGGRLQVDACAVDAGDGGHYDKVLSFCQPRASRRVMAIKGAAGARPAIVASTQRSRAAGGCGSSASTP